jgi:hypothetical protein
MALQGAVEYGGPVVLGLLTGSSVDTSQLNNSNRKHGISQLDMELTN